MKTFFNWLIANIEGAIVVFCMTIALLYEGDAFDVFNVVPPVSGFLLILACLTVLSGAIYIAIHTWNNFDDVVSRQMLYRNSNVSFLDSRFKYTLSRFGAAIIFLCVIWATIL